MHAFRQWSFFSFLQIKASFNNMKTIAAEWNKINSFFFSTLSSKQCWFNMFHFSLLFYCSINNNAFTRNACTIHSQMIVALFLSDDIWMSFVVVIDFFSRFVCFYNILYMNLISVFVLSSHSRYQQKLIFLYLFTS